MTKYTQVTDAVPRKHYVATGVQTVFPFDFQVAEAAHLEVWVDDVLMGPAGYALSGLGVAVGGSVLFTVPPAQGARITLRRRLRLTGQSDFPDWEVQAKPLNDALGFQLAAVQQVADEVGLAVKRSFRSLSSADLTLPEPEPGKAIKWNAAATGLENSAADMDQALSMAQARAESARTSELAAAVSAGNAAAQANASAASASAAQASQIAAAASAASASGTVKVSATDSSANHLSSSLSAGSNVALTVLNAGADETLRISVTGLAAVANSGAYADLTGLPVLGGASALASDTDTNLAANSDTRLATQKAVKAYVDGRSVSGADITALQQDVCQLYLTQAITSAAAAGGFANGGFDAFNADTIGANSAGQTYDGTNKLYANPGGWSANLLTGGTATASTDRGGVYVAASAFSTAPTTYWEAASTTGWVQMQLASAVALTKYSLGASTNETLDRFPKSWQFQGSSNGSSWTTLDTQTNVGAWSSGEVRSFTFANATAYLYYRLNITANQGGGFVGCNNLQGWSYASPANMTLVGNILAPAPSVAPATIAAELLYKAVDACTLNADITLELSRDGGATYGTASLSDTGATVTANGYKVLWASLSVAGQPAGTSVRYRIKTLNNKQQQIKGVALMAK